MEKQTGIDLIVRERAEQLKKHRKSLKHDREYNRRGELAFHAAILASPKVLYEKREYANSTHFNKAEPDSDWNLPNMAYAPDKSNVIINNNILPQEKRIKQLIVAGALIAAEIDRLNAIK